MRKTVLALVALLTVLATAQVFAADKKNRVEQVRKTASFERISLHGSPKVKYQQGKTCSVRVLAPQSIIDRVQTTVQNHCLTVSVKNSSNLFFGSVKGDDIVVYVTSPDLIAIDVHGSGDFECKSHLDTDNLRIQLKGSGDVELADVICDAMSISLVGSGDVGVKRLVAQRTSVELVGSGDVEVRQRQVKQTQLELKGSGDIGLLCDQCGTVNCRLVGSGDIKLSGTIHKLDRTTRGSGDIKTKGLTIR